MSYYQLRDETWPYGRAWGDERQAVRNYLKDTYIQNNCSASYGCSYVETTYQTVRNEAQIILQWWWTNRYGQSGAFDFNNPSVYFGTYLLREYQDSDRVDPTNNIVPGPR